VPGRVAPGRQANRQSMLPTRSLPLNDAASVEKTHSVFVATILGQACRCRHPGRHRGHSRAMRCVFMVRATAASVETSPRVLRLALAAPVAAGDTVKSCIYGHFAPSRLEAGVFGIRRVGTTPRGLAAHARPHLSESEACPNAAGGMRKTLQVASRSHAIKAPRACRIASLRWAAALAEHGGRCGLGKA